MKTLAKYHVCNHCVIGAKTFKNILIGPDKLQGLSRNGPLMPICYLLALIFILIILKSKPLSVFPNFVNLS